MQSVAFEARASCFLSVVLVRDNTDPDAYCTGCVVVKSKAIPGSLNKTLIITSSEFVKGREHNLNVLFATGNRGFKASVLRIHEAFCILSVKFNHDCEAVVLLEDNVVLDNSRCFMYVPNDSNSTRFVFTYATCDSLESYEVGDYKQPVPTSTDYFTVSCNYFGKTVTGLNRLTGAPVFCASGGVGQGRIRGVVLQDLRQTSGCSGREFKVALTASHVRRVLENLDPPPPQRGPKRKRGKKSQQ